MRFIYSKFRTTITVLEFLMLIEISNTQNTQNIEKMIEPVCDGRNIKYSIFAKLKEYLEFKKNIDGREIYNSLNIFKSKKIGTLRGTYYDKAFFESVKEYDTYAQLFSDLRTLKIDGIIQPDRYAEDQTFFSDDLSLFPEAIQTNKIAFGIQKNNTILKNQINEFINSSHTLHNESISLWTRLNFDEKHIDTKLTGEKGILNVVVRFANYPYTYKQNGEIMGSEIEFLYSFAKKYGYKLHLTEVDSYEAQIESIKSNSSHIAAGYFIIKDDIINDINYSDVIYESKVYIIVRYYNLPESIEFKSPHDSIEQFNGEKIGLIVGSNYYSATSNFFPKSEIITYPTIADI